MKRSVSIFALMLCASAEAQTPSTTFTYDANGNLTSRTDLLNHTTSNQYDALNRLIKITDPATGQTHLGYNGQGRLTQVTDPRSLVTSYTVDGLGNQTQLVSPDTGTSAATYDAAGNVLTRTDAKGQVTQYLYDALNRPTRATYHDNSRDDYTWDQGTNGKGRLTQIDQKNPAGTIVMTIQYGYDALGRTILESRQLAGQTYTTQYQYSGTGRLTRLTYPSGRKVDYGYNGQGQVTSLTLTDTNNQATVLASNIQYHPFGGVKSLLNGAGQTLTFGMDVNGRPSTYTLGGQLWQVGYDDANRITAQVNTANVTQAGSYTYDVLDRLTQASLPSIAHGYSYDATGNRTGQTSGASSRTYATSATSNRLTGITGSNPKTYSYDNNGSITGDGTIAYTYDVRGRIVSSTGALGTTTYVIDPRGQRVRKTNSTEDSVFHYDTAGHLISTTTAAGGAKEDVIYLGDRPVAVIR
jgi:YD repeat-containing protein